MTTYTFRGIALPPELQESLDAYIQTGRPTGDFLRSCIENDLKEACGRADDENMARIPAIVSYLYNYAPMNCWGFKGAAKQWIERKMEERKGQKA